jgi:hypothetical protein
VPWQLGTKPHVVLYVHIVCESGDSFHRFLMPSQELIGLEQKERGVYRQTPLGPFCATRPDSRSALFGSDFSVAQIFRQQQRKYPMRRSPCSSIQGFDSRHESLGFCSGSGRCYAASGFFPGGQPLQVVKELTLLFFCGALFLPSGTSSARVMGQIRKTARCRLL